MITGQMADATGLIEALEKEGYNVYPVQSMTKFMSFIDEVQPDAIINMAHGRMGDKMVDYLKAKNILLFAPLTINSLVDEWEKDPMGMAGGFMSQSIVTPEIDGAIRPFALFAQYEDEEGLRHSYAVPERLKTFVSTINNYLNLNTKPNSEKKVAIYYYKGPGQNALTAAGMEVVPSLYNLLVRMKQEGYNISGLPANAEKLGKMIQAQGAVFNSYAEGAFNDFMQKGHPETGVYNTDPYNMIGSSPYGEMIVNNSDSYSYNSNANLTLLFKIMKGLTLSVQGGYDYDNSPSYSFRSKLDSPGAINSASNTSALHNYWQNTNNLTWQKQFGDHSFTAMAVWEISRSWDSQLKGTGSNLNNESVGYWNLGNAAIRDASNSYTEFSLASGIVRANYVYKKRYFITAALRADGSSKFQGDNKWGYFPSAAIAWDIAQESFMSNQHVLDQLKLRASFGVTGNQDIAAYSTLGMLSGASYGWGTSTSSTGYWGNQFATPDITWEKTYQYDLGLDLSLGGFNITVDWFKKQTKDLLFQKQVPKYNGGGTYWVNQGKLNNTGVEMSLTTFPVKGAVTWETSLNASYVKNEVADLAGDDFVLTANYCFF